ncbi:MAG: hypothetical protein KAT43_03590 [Nanoarchaeota archaeon]|nr:hypothetical protein [Nanoarchaeota archaeon]
MSMILTMDDYFKSGREVVRTIDVRPGDGGLYRSKLPTNPGLFIAIRPDLSYEGEFVTILHEFGHLHNFRTGGPCSGCFICDLFENCGECRTEREIEDLSQRLYDQNGFTMTYLRWRIHDIKSTGLREVQEWVQRLRERRKGQLFMF